MATNFADRRRGTAEEEEEAAEAANKGANDRISLLIYDIFQKFRN